MNGWIIFGFILIAVVLGALWILADDSIVRIPPGALGLLMVRGRATDETLEPGVHWVPRIRRREVVLYPSVEAVYRAGIEAETDRERLEYAGPAIFVRLGDRASGTARFTVRLRLDPAHLREVHNRFGRAGLWGAVRDLSSSVVRSSLNDPEVGVEDIYGTRRHELEARILHRLQDEMASDGFLVSHFSLDHIDLGRTEEAIQSAVRARLEMAREEAEFDMRLERARRDAAIAAELHGVDIDVALRYRETDAWMDLASQMARTTGIIPEPPNRGKSITDADIVGTPDDGEQA
jgi:regulator of protease activity HflC (stomatin/prohibitin superfamily)